MALRRGPSGKNGVDVLIPKSRQCLEPCLSPDYKGQAWIASAVVVHFEHGWVNGLVDLRPSDQCLEPCLFRNYTSQAWIACAVIDWLDSSRNAAKIQDARVKAENAWYPRLGGALW